MLFVSPASVVNSLINSYKLFAVEPAPSHCFKFSGQPMIEAQVFCFPDKERQEKKRHIIVLLVENPRCSEKINEHSPIAIASLAALTALATNYCIHIDADFWQPRKNILEL